MNTITNAERDRIAIVARFVVRLDDNLAVANYDEAMGAIIAKFGISEDRAKGAVSRAARANRHKIVEWIETNQLTVIKPLGSK